MEKSSENKIYRAIGLMSGTAMDGIDAALIETDGYNHIKSIAFYGVTHDPILRQSLKAQLNKNDYDQGVERNFTLAQVQVIDDLLSKVDLKASDIDIVGFHGQTTHHDPDNGITVQMVDGELLADALGIDVVYDFRKNDMRYGGQGAPLLPVYHRALVRRADIELPVVILNMGGVGNITYINSDEMIAFDTGPANALIDDWVKNHTGQDFDAGGLIASQGIVDNDVLAQFLSLPYFEKPYPKSLDRNDFKNISVEGLSLEDGATTLTAMTVQSIAAAIAFCPEPPKSIYVTGGGRHNSFIMSQIKMATKCQIYSVDDLGWNGDAIEAEGFAYMAVRSLLGQNLTFPKTTGCDMPTTGGVHIISKSKVA